MIYDLFVMLNAVKHPAKSLAKYQREILHFVPLDLQSNRKYGRNAYFCCMKEADRPTVQVNHARSKYDLYPVLDLHS